MDESCKSTSFFWDIAQFEGESCKYTGLLNFFG